MIEENRFDEAGVTIEGIMDVRVSLNGFVYWDGEYNYIKDGEYILGFAFSFLVEGAEYSDFNMEHIDWYEKFWCNNNWRKKEQRE